jgi:5-methylthioadenosine/S-adenosylhomocysteine deaminase
MLYKCDLIINFSELTQKFELLKNQVLEVNLITGKIVSLDAYLNQNCQKHFRHLIIPSFATAHSHAFQFAMRGFADNPFNFSDWVNKFLYPTVEKLDESSFRIILKKFFKQLLRNGVTTLGEFHYLHHNKKLYDFDLIFLEEAAISGIRLSFLQSAYDLGTRDAQKKFHSTINGFLSSLDTLEQHFKTFNRQDNWSLSVAPHSLHGCSPELLSESVKWALDKNRKWHIHLAEQKNDINFSNYKFSKSPLFALEEILKNNLNDKSCLVHAVWLDKNEQQLFNERGLNLIYNPQTNMYLGDGITNLFDMGLNLTNKFALGTDSNNALNMLQEAKLAECLQRVSKLEMGILSSHRLFASITCFSGDLLNLPIGQLKENYFADFLEINLSKISLDIENSDIDYILNNLIFSGFESSLIEQTYIGGKAIDN